MVLFILAFVAKVLDKKAGPRSTVGRVRYPVWPHTFVSPSADSREAVVSYWRKYVHEVLVNRLGGLSLPRKSVVRLTDCPDMTLDVYCGRITTKQQQLEKKVQVSHSQVPAGQAGIRGPLYPKNSI